MATLRQLIDGSREAFDATLRVHRFGEHVQTVTVSYGKSRVEAASEEIQRAMRIAERLTSSYEEYQHGYSCGFADGMRAAMPKPEPVKQPVEVKKQELRFARDVDFDD